MTSSWKPLNLSFSDPLLPLLFVKYDFGPSQYTVILTDLTYIWSETLERRQIVKRALNVDTSIDPSESTDQLHQLLRNIQKPLDGEEGAILSFERQENSKRLVLQTTTQLPASLNPLHWPFNLDPAPQDLLTTELLLPCLSQQYTARAQINSLLQQLKDKDQVINKLIDRMQSDGSDFSKIFPGAIASKGETKLSVQESARKSVKGLGAFNQERWRKDLSAALGLSANLRDIVPQIFTPGSTDTLEVNRSTSHGDWWHEVKDASPQEQEFTSAAALRQSKPTNPENSPSNRQSGGHYRRSGTLSRVDSSIIRRGEKPTPISKQKSARDELETESDHGSTTTDANDGDVQSPKSKYLPPRGTSAEPATPAVDSRSPPKSTKSLRKVCGSEANGFVPQSPLDAGRGSSETDVKHDFGSEYPLIERPKLAGAIQKPRPKLGRIGGNLNRNLRNEEGDRPAEGESTVIGDASPDMEDKTESQHPINVIESPRLSRALVQPASPVTIRESSQERANNKREQLKRNLENKTNSTVKRKRKF